MTTSSDPYRVLIADDDVNIRKVMKTLLLGFNTEIVAEAADGAEAIQAFEQHRPDITFLDIEMPVKNGREALAEIMQISRSAAVVMLTAVTDMSVADSCVDAGAQGYIRKGATPGALKLLIEAQLDKLKPVKT